MSRQCPNCGGYRVTSQAERDIYRIHPITKRLVPEREYVEHQHVWLWVFSFIGLIAGGAIGAIAAPSNGAAIVSFLAVGFVIGFVVAWWRAWFLFAKHFGPGTARKLWKKATRQHYRYACQLCNFSWEWVEGQPYPYQEGRTLAPNAAELRRLGEQRLEREEAARREHEAVMWNVILQQRRDQ